MIPATESLCQCGFVCCHSEYCMLIARSLHRLTYQAKSGILMWIKKRRCTCTSGSFESNFFHGTQAFEPATIWTTSLPAILIPNFDQIHAAFGPAAAYAGRSHGNSLKSTSALAYQLDFRRFRFALCQSEMSEPLLQEVLLVGLGAVGSICAFI